MKQNRLIPWFGSGTANAPVVGDLLKGCTWVGIPFCGGLSEVPHIKASTIVVNDLHSHVINLCRVLIDPALRPQIESDLDLMPFHPDSLADAQATAEAYDRDRDGMPNVLFARAYFVSQWMGRSGNGGTDKEFTGKLPIRGNAGGGDSCKRFRSARESIGEWAAVMRRCNFDNLDFRPWLKQFNGDTTDHGYYVDAPWVKEGDAYKHKFTIADHRELAGRLRTKMRAKVVVRYGDHPLIRDLYAGWKFVDVPSRNQGNNAVQEVLIVNR